MCTPLMIPTTIARLTAVELVQPIIWVHITPLVINSLGGRDTQTHTETHTDTHTQMSLQKQ